MLYPLRFESIFQRYLWGGHRLGSLLNKACGTESAAESWEIVDHGDYQSKVLYGPLRGLTLNQLMQQFGSRLVGQANWRSIQQPDVPPALRGRFPLLFKFLDANQALSIQVHPDDHYAARMTPPDLGKTEAWFVLHAEPGAKIYCGLAEGVSAADFARAVQTGGTAELMHQFEPQIGDAIFIPAGTMHALGAGLVIAEIQQASNTTFRVYDWGRVDQHGVPRPLHLEQAMEVTRFDRGPVNPIRPQAVDQTTCHELARPRDQALIHSDKFVLSHCWHPAGSSLTLAPASSFRILAVIEGGLQIQGDPSNSMMRVGDTALIPAECSTEVFSGSGAKYLLITN